MHIFICKVIENNPLFKCYAYYLLDKRTSVTLGSFQKNKKGALKPLKIFNVFFFVQMALLFLSIVFSTSFQTGFPRRKAGVLC